MAPNMPKKLTSVQKSRADELKLTHMRLREKAPDALNRDIVQSRLDSINEIWSEARKTHAEIVMKDDAESDPYITDNVFAQMKVIYEDALDDMLTLINHFEVPSVTNVVPYSSSAADVDKAVESAAASSIEVHILDRFPKFPDFIKFLEQRALAPGMIMAGSRVDKVNNLNSKQGLSSKRALHMSRIQSFNITRRKSPLCLDGYYLGNCPNFLRKSPLERRREVHRLHLCFNCLGFHNVQKCESKQRCKVCRALHHSLLHFDSVSQSVSSQRTPKNPGASHGGGESAPTSSVSVLTAGVSTRSYVAVLATAQVILIGPRGARTRVRALLDQGSEASFVTEAIAQVLGLPKRRVQISISGLGASAAGTASFTTHLSLRSIHNPDFQLETPVLILPKLTSHLPSRKLLDLDLDQFSGLPLADPHFHEPDSIDLILGADVYGRLLKLGLRRFPPSQLIAQDTSLGWIISGPMQASVPRRADCLLQVHLVSMHCASNDDLQGLIQRFWEIEEIAAPARKFDSQDEACEQQFLDTHSREPDGRYVVRLPIKSKPPEVASETRRLALGSLSHMHRRFSCDPRLALAYREFMGVYEQLGHMEKIPAKELTNLAARYLPHHAVVQSSASHWKLRVVFDASRRTQDHHCLNEFLRAGRALQSDLSLILLNWRRYRFVFTADLVKMFRQIRVHPDDQNLQRIFWSPSPAEPVVEYRLTTVTYRTACAPYLAICTLSQLAQDEQHYFPLGARCLQFNTYVDDTFAGADDLSIAIQKRREFSELSRSAGVELDKWSAKHPDLLPTLASPDGTATDKRILPDETVKALGVRWKPASDMFGFTVQDGDIKTHTKRTILSNIARLFDPLGWLAPVTDAATILMQGLWILKCDWDTPLPSEIYRRCSEYCGSLSSMQSLVIDSWLGTTSSSQCQIHGFADASSRAYAATVYLRVRIPDSQYRVLLLIAKTKLSPVKTLSIPNLELSGAALLVNLIRHVGKLDFFRDLPVIAWSDSQVVLSGLRKQLGDWKTFVANRVSLIQTELPSAEWRDVPTKENPADLATRGVKPADLETSKIWWHGPQWLSLYDEKWPKQSDTLIALHAQNETSEPEILGQFSSLTRLIRVVAYCLRPLVNLRKRKIQETPSLSFLTSAELASARLVIIRLAQTYDFSPEIKLLSSKRPLAKRNSLQKLNPIEGESDRILRVGGCLSHSTLSHDSKHPPILPHRSNLSRLFVRHAHLSSLHGGPALTLSVLQQQVWILGRNRLVKTKIRNCVKCQRVKPRLASQLLGDLPTARVIPARPFTTTCLDYAGPIHIRTTKGRGQRSYKGYIALFVCFATRAIHLELVSDLTTASFLAAYRWFVGRRVFVVSFLVITEPRFTVLRGSCEQCSMLLPIFIERLRLCSPTMERTGRSSPRMPHTLADSGRLE